MVTANANLKTVHNAVMNNATIAILGIDYRITKIVFSTKALYCHLYLSLELQGVYQWELTQAQQWLHLEEVEVLGSFLTRSR